MKSGYKTAIKSVFAKARFMTAESPARGELYSRAVVEGLEIRRMMSLTKIGNSPSLVSDAQGDTPAIGVDANDDQIVVWAGNTVSTSGTTAIWAEGFNKAGVSLGTLMVSNPSDQDYPDAPAVAVDAEGDAVVVWDDYNEDAESDQSDAATFRLIGSSFVSLSGPFELANDAAEPSVAIDDAQGDFVVAWHDYSANPEDFNTATIMAEALAFGSDPYANNSGPFIVDSQTYSVVGFPSASANASGDINIAWAYSDPNSSTEEVAERQYVRSGSVSSVPVATRAGDLVVFTGSSNISGPNVAVGAGGDFTVAWGVADVNYNWSTDFQEYSSAGAEETQSPVDIAASDQDAVAPMPVAVYDGTNGLLVTWDEADPSTSNEYDYIEAQRYDSSMTANPAPIIVSVDGTSTHDSTSATGLSCDGGLNFFTAWQSGPNYDEIVQQEFGLNAFKVSSASNSDGGNAIGTDDTVSGNLPGIVLKYNFPFTTTGGVSPALASNYAITQNGAAVAITNVAADTSTDQVTLTFGAPLAAGNYVLTAMATIADQDLVPLYGNGTTLGSNYALAFTVAANQNLPTARITAADLSAASATTTVTVVYSAQGGATIDSSKIIDSSISISGPASGPSVTGVTTTGSDTSITATFTIAGPAGNYWSAASNGTYTVTAPAGSIVDSAGHRIPVATAQFNVDILPGVVTAVIDPALVTAQGTSPGSVTVTYMSTAQPIDTSTLGTGNLEVDFNGTSITPDVDGVNVVSSDNSVIVDYTFVPPGGTWSFAGDGTYTISIAAGAVSDLGGGRVGATTGTLQVQVPGTVTVEALNFGKAGLPPAALSSSKIGGVVATVENTSSELLKGVVSVQLFASLTPDVASDAIPIQTMMKPVKLNAGGTVKFAFSKVSLPASGGLYYFVSQALFNGALGSFATSSTSTIQVAPKFVDIETLSFTSLVLARKGVSATGKLLLENLGNFTAAGSVTVNFSDPVHPTLAFTKFAVRIKPGKTTAVNVKIANGDSLAPSVTRYITAVIVFAGDSNRGNNSVVSDRPLP